MRRRDAGDVGVPRDGIHDTGDSQPRASPQIIQFKLTAGRHVELTRHVASHVTLCRVTARCDRLSFELPGWLELARLVEPRPGNHNGSIVRARHDIDVRRGCHHVARAHAVNLWKDRSLAHQSGRRGGRRRIAWCVVRLRGVAGRNYDVCAEQAEFLGQLAFDVKFEIQEGGNYGSAADHGHQRHRQPPAIASK